MLKIASIPYIFKKKIENKMHKGRVFVGQKHSRGVFGQKTVSNGDAKNIDVTSGSKNLIGAQRVCANTLSPLTLGPVFDESGLQSLTFEGYWQGSKYWAGDAGHIDSNKKPTPKWFQFRARQFALSKGKRRPLPLKQFGRPIGAIYNEIDYSETSGYVRSRKEIYVPIYANLIRNSAAVVAMREMVRVGESVMIIDGDGPPRNLYPNGMEMTAENWKKMIDDPKYCFGHGYVVAALVAGIDVAEIKEAEKEKVLEKEEEEEETDDANKKRKLD